MSFQSRKNLDRLSLTIQYGTYALLVVAAFNLYFVFKNNILGVDRLYTTLLFILLFIGIIFGHIRKNTGFYFASFREMPDALYWFSLQQLYTIANVIRVYFKVEMSIVLQEFYIIIILLSVSLYVVILQTKPWISRTIYSRHEKIRKLFKKSRLSKNEINSLTPELIEIAKNSQKLPISWRVVKWVMVFIFAALLNIVVDFLIEHVISVTTFNEIMRNIY